VKHRSDTPNDGPQRLLARTPDNTEYPVTMPRLPSCDPLPPVRRRIYIRIDRLMSALLRIELHDSYEALATCCVQLSHDVGHRRNQRPDRPRVTGHALVLLKPNMMDPGLLYQSCLDRISELVRILCHEDLVARGTSVGEELSILLAFPARAAAVERIDMINLVASESALQDRKGLHRHVLIEKQVHAAEGIPPSRKRCTNRANSTASVAAAALTDG